MTYLVALLMGREAAVVAFPELQNGYNVLDGKVVHPKVVEAMVKKGIDLNASAEGHSSLPISAADVGGIDFNAINVDWQGIGVVDIQFDPVEVQQIIDMGITGFTPVIINIVPLPSVLPLLGLALQREEEYELSKVN